MSMRPIRRVVALVAAFGIVFAQLAVTAYACPVQGSALLPATARSAPVADAADHPCGGMATEPAAPQTVACEVHCTDGATLPAPPDLPPVALTVLPLPPMPLVAFAAGDVAARTPYVALPGAPPLTLQFCRLLI